MSARNIVKYAHPLLSLCCLTGWLSPVLAAAPATTYPVKPIRMIAPEAGGGNDFVARILAHELGTSLGQQVIVDNRGGTGGAIAAALLMRAQPDGYTLMFYSSGIWTAPLLQTNVHYDAVRDFSPISAAASSPNLVVV